MSPEARERSFDELARGLASGSVSRRKALKLMGAALVGGALASIPGAALAQRGSNSACDAFCHENFSGRDAGRCTRRGARGTGPCYSCTEAGCGPHFTKPNCTDVSGQTYNCSACKCECPSGQVVCGDRCATGTSIGGSCNSNAECCTGFCASGVCRVRRFGFTCFCSDGSSRGFGCLDSCIAGIEPCNSFCAEHGAGRVGGECAAVAC
jgi:hypothetical protein